MLDAMKWSRFAAVSCAVLMLAALAEEAWAGGRGSGGRSSAGASRGGHSGPHHHRGGTRVFVGGAFFVGPAYYYSAPYYPYYYYYYYYYYYPYYYDPGYYYPMPAPVYIEQDPATDAQYWYYCPAAGGYYPYVRDCPGGWQRVLPEPEPKPPAG